MNNEKPKLKHVLIFANGMVACCDTNGQQISELQGPWHEVKTAIQEYAREYWLDVIVRGRDE